MRKINIVIATVVMCFAALNLQAQSENPDWKAVHAKMMKQKFEFLQKELRLEPSQMEEFWRVYQQYDNEISACHDRAWKQQCEMTKSDPNKCERMDEDLLPENVALQLIEQRRMTERQLQDIEEKYSRDFVRILSPQKALKLHRLEKQFMRDVMSNSQGEKERGIREGGKRPHPDRNRQREDGRKSDRK